MVSAEDDTALPCDRRAPDDVLSKGVTIQMTESFFEKLEPVRVLVVTPASPPFTVQAY